MGNLHFLHRKELELKAPNRSQFFGLQSKHLPKSFECRAFFIEGMKSAQAVRKQVSSDHVCWFGVVCARQDWVVCARQKLVVSTCQWPLGTWQLCVWWYL